MLTYAAGRKIKDVMHYGLFFPMVSPLAEKARKGGRQKEGERERGQRARAARPPHRERVRASERASERERESTRARALVRERESCERRSLNAWTMSQFVCFGRVAIYGGSSLKMQRQAILDGCRCNCSGLAPSLSLSRSRPRVAARLLSLSRAHTHIHTYTSCTVKKAV